MNSKTNYHAYQYHQDYSRENRLNYRVPDDHAIIPIVQYNLLSSELSPPDHFRHCDPKDLDSSTRLERICTKLQNQMLLGAIICLQEISRSWVGRLHILCQQNDYYLITSLYGAQFSGYMGVGIAFPIDEYDALEIDISRLSDTVDWPFETQIECTRVSSFSQLLKSFLNPFTSFFGRLFASFLNFFSSAKRYSIPPPEKYNVPFDPWKVAKSKHNAVVWARLRQKDHNVVFCAATYHMPCLFGTTEKRQTMILHTSLLSNYLQRMCKDDPYLLAGDFNFKPSDSSYRLLTTGHLDQNDPDLPYFQNIEGVKKSPDWANGSVQKLFSAYNVKNGKEPKFTNKVRVRDSQPFIATLDYIFFSPGWEVRSVLPLPHGKQCKGYLPNSSEPSDHLLIGADFFFKNKKKVC